MKIYVHPIESASGAKELYDTVSKTVDKLFGKISKVLNKVASWGDVEDPFTLVGSKIVFDVVVPVTYESDSDEDEVEEGEELYKFLWSISGANDDERYCVCDFYLKLAGAPDSEAVSKTGVIIHFRDSDESEDEYIESLEKSLDKIVQKLLSDYTKGEIDSYDSIEVAQS